MGPFFWYASFLDFRFRGNNGNLAHLVIPAKAGIQLIRPELLRSYRNPKKGF